MANCFIIILLAGIFGCLWVIAERLYEIQKILKKNNK
jgi:hypothetical protein